MSDIVMEDSLVRYIVGASRIKYEVLDQILEDYKHRGFKKCIIYVDAHSIFYRLYRSKDLAAIYADNREELTKDLVVGFMNVLGHYRRYIATRFGLDNDIFATFNREPCKYCTARIPEFNEHMIDQYSKDNPIYGFINSAVDAAWKFICGLSPYFEGIYCINTHGLDDLAAFLSMTQFNDEYLYILFSRNMFHTQILNTTHQNIVQLYNKRDDSFIIEDKTCYSMGVMRESKTEVKDKLNANHLPFIWAIGGCKDISVPRLPKVVGFVKAVKLAIKANLYAHEDVDGFITRCMKACTNKDTVLADYLDSHRELIAKRYDALNIYNVARNRTSSQNAKIKSQLYDLYDETELEQLNELLAAGSIDPELFELENLNLSQGVHYN